MPDDEIRLESHGGRRVSRSSGIPPRESPWRRCRCSTSSRVVAVIGQSVGQPDALGTGRDLTEHVALASGRPVVTVPRCGIPARVGDRLLVAWDAGREAARAVADLLAVLQCAEQVLVYSVPTRTAASASTSTMSLRCDRVVVALTEGMTGPVAGAAILEEATSKSV